MSTDSLRSDGVAARRLHAARTHGRVRPALPALSALLATLLAGGAAGAVAAGIGPNPADYFAIQVVDEATGRGVPLVELATTSNVRFWTDSNGLVAICEPDLLGREVFFHVKSHGYEYPADGFGYRGTRLQVTAGESATIKLKRRNVAERLYRVTGAGIYRDSVLLGRPVPTSQPVMNGLVCGQDSVLTVIYRGRVRWFWGDTARLAYPLGNFQTSGATSLLPTDGGLDPSVGVDLTYFVDEHGFSREMAPVKLSTPLPCWIDGLAVLADGDGRERLYATYTKVRGDMSAVQRGFMVYDDDADRFVPTATFPVDTPLIPGGAPFRGRDGEANRLYFPRPLPCVRVPATGAAYVDIGAYEAYTPLKPGCTEAQPELERDDAGALRWAWKQGAPPLSGLKQEELLKAGKMTPAEARFRLYDVATGKPLVTHGASVAWNERQRRWTAIVLEIWGTSALGEIWYAEADTPLGPWCYAVKIVTHDQYSFYNPRHHPFFDEDGGRRIYFEGTYTTTFSGNPTPTPRYDYNQIMYRLDLDDPRTVLPVPFYAGKDGGFTRAAPAPPDAGGPRAKEEGPSPSAGGPPPAFFAWDKPVGACVAVYARIADDGGQVLAARPVAAESVPAKSESLLFYALAADAGGAPPTTEVLYELPANAGRPRTYVLGQSPSDTDRAGVPVCRVWRPPHMLPPPPPAE